MASCASVTSNVTHNVLVVAALVLLGARVSVQQTAAPATAAPADPLVAGFSQSTVASVADAVDQVVGKRGLPGARHAAVRGWRVRRPGRDRPGEAGRPRTGDTGARGQALGRDDRQREPGDVGVIVMEGSLDVAAIGGLMGTAAKARGMAGMVLDGAVRDIAELRALALPVYARAVSPATAVSRYASVAKQVPVDCAGVTIAPGDIIVAGEDGVVVVPKDRAADVLKRSQEIDQRESKMVPYIKQFRSLQKAIEVFNRI